MVAGMHDPYIPSDLPLLLNHFWGNNQTVNDMVQTAYPSSNYANTTELLEHVLRDFFFLCPSSRAMLALDAYGVRTYLYQFVYKGDWIEDPSMGACHRTTITLINVLKQLDFVPRGQLTHLAVVVAFCPDFLGVYHSAELEFVFDNAWPPFIHAFSVRDQTMADTFGYYWSNLVKYLDPNGPSPSPDQVVWPRYQADTLQSMSLDVPSSVVAALMKEKCDMSV
jgi:carboxylesterase type B